MVDAQREVALIAGAGPGLGAAMARTFAKDGMSIVLAARNTAKFSSLLDEIGAYGVEGYAVGCDVTREANVTHLFKTVITEIGRPSLIVYNVEHFVPGSILEMETAAFEECWRAMCLGGFIVGREAAKAMLGAGFGTIVYIGATAALRGRQGYLNLAVGKFGVRALAQVMARELGVKGIHVAHVVVDGSILSPTSAIDAEKNMSSLAPEEIAKVVLQLHRQHKSAWTQEIDLRPWVEPF
jgi:NAD(P)-dependent dehydrogenase (short-subunit alcohol dehydrogenase family)